MTRTRNACICAGRPASVWPDLPAQRSNDLHDALSLHAVSRLSICYNLLMSQGMIRQRNACRGYDTHEECLSSPASPRPLSK